MDVSKMRSGYTTGASAAAGMKASLLALLRNEFPKSVDVSSPQDVIISVPVKECTIVHEREAKATILKDGGDDPDVTHGAEIITTVVLTNKPGISFFAGDGVGTVTKKGLALSPGEPAINPGPREMMRKVYEELCPPHLGVDVTISVPKGHVLAKKTLNSTLGIEGGIGIIGTTGIVKPMSEEGFKNALVPQLQVMYAAGFRTAVLVPGRIGADLAEHRLHIPKEQVAEVSNFVGFMLEEAVRVGFKKILLVGHLGKIIKISNGSFHTHNRMSDGRMETLGAYAALMGASKETVKAILDCSTTEAAMPIIEKNQLSSIYTYGAERATVRAERYVAGEAEVGVVISTLDGNILGLSERAKEIGGVEGWNIHSSS